MKNNNRVKMYTERTVAFIKRVSFTIDMHLTNKLYRLKNWFLSKVNMCKREFCISEYE